MPGASKGRRSCRSACGGPRFDSLPGIRSSFAARFAHPSPAPATPARACLSLPGDKGAPLRRHAGPRGPAAGAPGSAADTLQRTGLRTSPQKRALGGGAACRWHSRCTRWTAAFDGGGRWRAGCATCSRMRPCRVMRTRSGPRPGRSGQVRQTRDFFMQARSAPRPATRGISVSSSTCAPSGALFFRPRFSSRRRPAPRYRLDSARRCHRGRNSRPDSWRGTAGGNPRRSRTRGPG